MDKINSTDFNALIYGVINGEEESILEEHINLTKIEPFILERLIFLIRKIQTERSGIEQEDWTSSESELLMLTLENRDRNERILPFFEIIGNLIGRNSSAVQFKYYQLNKYLKEGIPLHEVLTKVKRGKRSLNTEIRKKNIIEPKNKLLAFNSDGTEKVDEEAITVAKNIKKISDLLSKLDDNVRDKVLMTLNEQK